MAAGAGKNRASVARGRRKDQVVAVSLTTWRESKAPNRGLLDRCEQSQHSGRHGLLSRCGLRNGLRCGHGHYWRSGRHIQPICSDHKVDASKPRVDADISTMDNALNCMLMAELHATPVPGGAQEKYAGGRVVDMADVYGKKEVLEEEERPGTSANEAAFLAVTPVATLTGEPSGWRSG